MTYKTILRDVSNKRIKKFALPALQSIPVYYYKSLPICTILLFCALQKNTCRLFVTATFNATNMRNKIAWCDMAFRNIAHEYFSISKALFNNQQFSFTFFWIIWPTVKQIYQRIFLRVGFVFHFRKQSWNQTLNGRRIRNLLIQEVKTYALWYVKSPV